MALLSKCHVSSNVAICPELVDAFVQVTWGSPAVCRAFGRYGGCPLAHSKGGVAAIQAGLAENCPKLLKSTKT